MDVDTHTQLMDRCLDVASTRGLFRHHPFGLTFVDWETQRHVYRQSGFFCPDATFQSGAISVVAASNYNDPSCPRSPGCIVLLDTRCAGLMTKVIKTCDLKYYNYNGMFQDFTSNILTVRQNGIVGDMARHILTRIDVRTGHVAETIHVPNEMSYFCQDQSVFVYETSHTHKEKQPHIFRHDESAAKFVQVV